MIFNSFFSPENTDSRFKMICRRARLRSQLAVRFALVSISLGLAVLALLTLPPQSGARISAPQVSKSKKQQRPKFVPGDVLVRYRSESLARSKSGKSSLLATSEGRLISAKVEHFDGSDLVSGLRIARVAAEATLDAVAALRKQPEVEYAEPNYILRTAAVPNDTHYALQTSFPKVGLPEAWDFTDNKGDRNIVVAVLDQGFKPNHVDLQLNVWSNAAPGSVPGINGDVNGYNFVNNTGTFFVQNDAEFHATHVAGIIGAVGNNNLGVAGVNWQVSLMSLKFLDEDGFGSTSDAIDALNYAKQMRNLWETSPNHSMGANVRAINASFGEKSFNQSFRDAIHQLNVGPNPILFVAAAGNVADGTREPNNDLVPEYPASYNEPNVISVASTSSTDEISSFSHFGGTSVDLAAPGENVLSTTPPCADPGPVPKLCDPDFPAGADAVTDTYTFVSGTSMSAPIVTGAAALLWSENPNLTVQEIKNLLLLNGDVIPALVGKTLSGRRLNVDKSFVAMVEPDTTAPGAVTNFRIASQSGRSFSLGWTASGDDGATGRAALYQLSFTDSTSGEEIPLKGVVPGKSGAAQLADVKVPFRHTAGTLKLREFDNKGNEGPVQSLSVGIPLSAADPYTSTTGAPVGLTPGNTNIGLQGDDEYADFTFPQNFSFPFFGSNYTSVTVSSNGALYFSDPYSRPDGTADDVPASPGAIGGQRMIAGLWEDISLETTLRSDAGVYFIPLPNATNPDRLVFRWQGEPCNYDGTDCVGGTQINFEIELNSSGVIKTRYGTGNANIFPTVGIGGGEQDGYIIASHTSEEEPRTLENFPEVTFTPRAQTVSTIQLSQATVNVAEATPNLTVTVTRSGDTTSVATVNYNTSDTDNFTIGCSQSSGGNAFGRCDFAAAIDSLTFAAGETSKTFTISILDDVIIEGPETFTVSISNPIGATLGATSSATVTITDNDTAPVGPNPIFSTPFFVRQQYLDFLSREPDPGGLAAWMGVLNNCSDVNNNPACDRIVVSSSFFLSQEFQLKGYFVYRFYRIAFNRRPTYTEMVTDMRAVTGTTPDEVYQKKAAYANAFTQRPEFTTAFGSVSNTSFVMTLLGRYQPTLPSIITPDPELPDSTSSADKMTFDLAALSNGIDTQKLTRAQVLRAIADSDEVFSREFNSAFVAMQYYGYLRRAPDDGGFTAWLNVLNANPSDSRIMVNGFMNSAEYRLRFGPQN